MTATEVAMAFVAAINSKDIEGLSDLMTADHIFIDGDGSEYKGKDRMKNGWKEHLELIPDLTLSVSEHYDENDTVVLLGWSSGTIIQNGELKPENSWRVPCAWRVVVESGKLAVWQLYSNQCALHEIYDRSRRASRVYTPGPAGYMKQIRSAREGKYLEFRNDSLVIKVQYDGLFRKGS